MIYEDLDEVIQAFVEPLVEQVETSLVLLYTFELKLI